ncbi:MAG: DUF11 domain-containing protein, partial [Acidobacteria bacterium]|nr:DUF11 domain-containing protein [Acidobacteriota bacterium]
LDVVDLAVSKTNGTTTSTPGGTTTYTITVSNSGPSNAVGATVTDTFPGILSGVTWTCAASAGSSCTAAGSGNISDVVTVLAGGNVTYSATGTIDAAATGSLSNTASATAPAGTLECVTANNSATDTDTLSASSDLAVTKTNGTTTSVPGNPTTYTIAVTNNGPSDAVGASVTDTFPAALSGVTWTCAASAGSSCTAAGSGDISDTVTVLVGGNVTYTNSGTIDPAATGILSNTASAAVAAGASDPTPGNNSATDTDTLIPEADLQVTKTDAADPPAPGDNVVYTIEVENLGPSDATGVVVTDMLPMGLTLVSTSGCAEDPSGAPTCTLGAIAAGANASFTLEAAAGAPPPVSVTNQACAAGNESDPVPGNDCDSEETTFDATPPTVTNVDSVADSGDGMVEECETVRTEIVEMKLTFSEPVNVVNTTDPASATNPANYRLVTVTPGAGFDTTGCTGGTGADTVIAIDSVSWDAMTLTASVMVNGGSAVPDGIYRLFVCGDVEDEAGNPLDGGAGAGTDFRRGFRVDADNLLADGHFDDYDAACVFGAWNSSDFGQVEISAEDVDTSPLSGSAHNTVAAGPGFDLEQCVELLSGQQYRLRADLRVDVAASTAIFAELSCEFFDQAACAGTSLGTESLPNAVFDTAMGWLPLELTFRAPTGT